MNLEVRVETLSGVGPAVATRLAKLGIHTISDLLSHYPKRYDDFSQVIPIRQMKPGLVTFQGTVVTVAARRARGRKLQIIEAVITDGTGTIKAIWFNQPYLVRQFPAGTEVLVAGSVEFRNNDLALQSPAIEKAEGVSKHTGRIVPIYSETEGFSSKQFRNIIMPLVPLIDDMPETLPPNIIKDAKLLSRAEAIRQLHAPTSEAELLEARHRIAFEELFYIIGASLAIKHEIKSEQAPSIKLDVNVAQAFTKALDFELTNGQRAAAWQILQDMVDAKPMNRLLEGDVGSGKTVVAMLAITMAIASGHQTALMVPTDILARQHYAKLQDLTEKLGIKMGLLLGRQPAAEKKPVIEGLKAGTIDFVVGTHALVSDAVAFKTLGLVVIDEQHRFGVEQRLALKEKAGQLPHLLSMTATPIPRTLALTVYGDLDVSIIDELPEGRKKVSTKILRPADREAAYGFIDRQIEQGRQVFVVCPLIEDSETLTSKSVTAELERLQKGPFKHRRIGMVHGKMKAPERDEVMQAFYAGTLDILVATSVIEVGIDVANATIMLIEGAERFGLAALHQLRGRVGRGGNQSYCMVASDSTTSGTIERLQALERTHDGFRLAQIDLELRGPGQVYGRRQHGMLELDMADLNDTRLVASVRAAAEKFITSGAQIKAYPKVVDRINKLKSVTSLD